MIKDTLTFIVLMLIGMPIALTFLAGIVVALASPIFVGMWLFSLLF